MIWLLPAAVVALAVLPLLVMIKRLAAETLELRREMHRFSDLRPALLELRSDATAFRAGLAHRAAQLPRR